SASSVSVSSLPFGVNSTCLLASSLPVPCSQVTLFAWNSAAIPPVSCSTTSSLRFCIVAMSILTLPTSMPCTASLSCASWYFQDESSSALDGIQPTFRQVPPSAGLPCLLMRFSIQAVLKPSCAQRMAAA